MLAKMNVWLVSAVEGGEELILEIESRVQMNSALESVLMTTGTYVGVPVKLAEEEYRSSRDDRDAADGGVESAGAA